MIKAVIGAKIYNVWLDMLKSLVPHGRTHRLSVMVAGMLQYAQKVAYKKAESNSKARKLAETFEDAFDGSDEEYLAEIIKIAENLFEDAGVRYKRKNRKGESYSIAEEAAYEFLNWENMPWER
jgi:hypothetical protein